LCVKSQNCLGTKLAPGRAQTEATGSLNGGGGANEWIMGTGSERRKKKKKSTPTAVRGGVGDGTFHSQMRL